MSVDITTLSIRVESHGIKDASHALGGLSTSAANTEKRVLKLIEATQKLQSVNTASVTAMNSYMEKLKQQTSLMQTLSTHTANTMAATAMLASAMALLTASLNALNQRTQDADRSQRRHNEGMREAHGLARGLAGSLGMLWVTYGNIAGMAVGLAIGASLKGIVTIGKDVEHTLEGIRVKGQETVGAINELRDSIYNLGSGVFGPQEVAKAFDTLVMAGLNAKQAMTSMSAALNLAIIGGTTVEKSAFTLVQVGTALGYTAEGYSRVGDVIAKTAAVSMSSVESLSEAFKSGSVVGKLYGASIVDIGVAFAALSNLGIRGSAAGTSLKNMYKELAADSAKLKDTMAMIGIKPGGLQDAQGNFLPLLKLFKELDEGLKQFGATEQKTLMARMANERGMKSLVEIYSLYREKLSASASAATGFTTELERMESAINNSYGFMAQGAAAMALTVDSQFKSVANTLKTTLAKAFQEIQPELSVVASSLKRAFGSSEFISGVQSLAIGVANLAVFMVQNSEAIWLAVRALLAFKVATMVTGLVTGLGSAMMALKVGMDAARLSAIGLQAAFGLLGIVLAAASVAMVLWATKRDEAMNAGSKASLDYMDDFTSKIKENTEQIREQIKLMNAGATAAEAYSLSQQQLAIQKVQAQGVEVVGKANEDRAEVFSSLSPKQKDIVREFMATGKRPTPTGHSYVDAQAEIAITRMTAANIALADAKKQVAQREKEAKQSLDENIEANKKLAEIADKRAKESSLLPGGGKGLTEAPDKAELNSALAGKINKLNEDIQAAKKQAEQIKKDAQSEYKQGLIGELGLIEKVREAEVSKQAAIGEAADKQLSILKTQANQEGAIATARGELQAAFEATKAANETADNARAENEVKNAQRLLKFEADAFEAKKEYKRAYEKEFEGKHQLELARLDKDIKAETDLVKKGELEKLQAKIEAAYQAGMIRAADKDAMLAFNNELDALKNNFKGVFVSTEGQGLAEMFKAASSASNEYSSKLDGLREKMSKLTDPKLINEAQAEMNNLANAQKKMWSSVAEHIGESLESAFGRGGKAVGSLIKIGVDYHNLENKTSGARIKAYGDAAGAAKGFFKEGTSGYKLMEGAEKAFRLLELAGMAKSLALTISTAAAKATAWVPAVIMSFMASMGPWGAAAAAVAIGAVLGGAFGGGSSPMSAADRQASAGRGSVLGDKDAKSESISKSLSIMEKNSGLGLVHSNDMVNSLRQIADSLGNLSSLVLRTSGLKDGVVPGVTEGVAGSSFGKIMAPITGFDKVVAKLFGTKTSIIDQGIKIGSSSLGGIDSVGVQAQSYADIETKKKFLGMTTSTKVGTTTGALPQEISDQFTLVIKSLQAGVEAAANSLGLGGDAFTEKMKTFIVDIGEISIKGLSGKEIEEQFAAVFSKLGDDMARFGLVGLDKFQKVGEGYFETLARVANNLIQVKDVFAVLGHELQLTGYAAIEVSESLVSAAGGLDKLTSGTKFFVDNFLTEAEKMAPITASVTKRLKELGQSELTTVELYKKKVMALDLTNAADQKLYAALLELAPAFKEVSDYATKAVEKSEVVSKMRELEIRLLEAQGKAQLALSMRREDELAALRKLDPALAAVQQQIYNALDKADGIKDAKADLEAAYNRESAALQTVIDKFKAFSESLKKFKESLKLGELSTLSPEQKYLLSKSKFQSTSAAAGKGDANALAELQNVAQTFLDLSRSYNASTEAYTSDFELVQKGLDEGIKAADTELSVAQAQLTIMKAQYESLMEIKKLLTFEQAKQNLSNAQGMSFTAGSVKKPFQLSDQELADARSGKVWSEMDFGRAYMAAHTAENNYQYVPIDGSHANGLDSVPFDNYLARLHAGERVQTAKAANASDENSTELVKLTKDMLDRISKMEEHTGASNVQRAAVAEAQAEQMDKMIRELDAVKRKVANA